MVISNNPIVAVYVHGFTRSSNNDYDLEDKDMGVHLTNLS
jgi:hypothetical protein